MVCHFTEGRAYVGRAPHDVGCCGSGQEKFCRKRFRTLFNSRANFPAEYFCHRQCNVGVHQEVENFVRQRCPQAALRLRVQSSRIHDDIRSMGRSPHCNSIDTLIQG